MYNIVQHRLHVWAQVAEAGEAAWVQEKQKRMLNWINRSQVALGARVLGKSSS